MGMIDGNRPSVFWGNKMAVLMIGSVFGIFIDIGVSHLGGYKMGVVVAGVYGCLGRTGIRCGRWSW